MWLGLQMKYNPVTLVQKGHWDVKKITSTMSNFRTAALLHWKKSFKLSRILRKHQIGENYWLTKLPVSLKASNKWTATRPTVDFFNLIFILIHEYHAI